MSANRRSKKGVESVTTPSEVEPFWTGCSLAESHPLPDLYLEPS